MEEVLPKKVRQVAMKALLKERAGYQVIPVHVGDIELLGYYGIKHCIHRLHIPFALDSSHFTDKRSKIEKYMTDNGIKLFDNIDSIFTIQNRVIFTEKLQTFLS